MIQTNDISLIGLSYTFKVVATNDYYIYNSIVYEYSFTLNIICMVESIKINDKFESVSYTTGRGPLKVSRNLSLVQTPNCGYQFQLTSDDELNLQFEYDT